MRLTIHELADIRQAAQTFVDKMDNRTIFAFYGEMGAGKTTFIKAICKQMGVEEVVTSPTFAIVNEYFAKMPANTPIYHFDFYRIRNVHEVYDMGYEEYISSGAVCFMEWPELIEDLLPENTVKVYIRQTENGEREISF